MPEVAISAVDGARVGAGCGLSIRGLSKSFGAHKTLVDVTVELAPGELLVALGPSGCGKTTLLRLLAGLEDTDSGEVWLGEKRIDTLPPKERDVSLVFQNYALYPHMSVAENLAFPLAARGVKKTVRQKEAEKIAALLGLTEKLKAKPASLSGGQRQRVALGRAIIRQPSLYLFDEPLSNLDTELRSRMRGEIVRLQKQMGACAVYVTHDQTEALTMADRILLLHEGKVQQIGTPEEIYRSPANMFVAGFVGAPKMNFISCRIQKDTVQPLGTRIDTFLPRGTEKMIALGEFVLGIRPEDIFPGPIGEYKGILTHSEFYGDRRVGTMSFNGTEIVFFTDSRNLRVGDTVSFNIRRDNILTFDSAGARQTL